MLKNPIFQLPNQEFKNLTHYDCSPQHITFLQFYKLKTVGECKTKPAIFQILPAQIQDTKTDVILQLFAKYHKILRTENFEASPGKSFSFLESVKLLGHQLQKNHIHPLKWKIDVFLRLQPSKNRKEIQNHVGFFKFTSKHFYNLQVFSGPIYLQLRDAIDFKLTPELQQTFDKFKKFKKAIANSENLFLCVASN